MRSSGPSLGAEDHPAPTDIHPFAGANPASLMAAGAGAALCTEGRWLQVNASVKVSKTAPWGVLLAQKATGALSSSGYCKGRIAPQKYAGEASAATQTSPPRLFGEGLGRNGKKILFAGPWPRGKRRSNIATSGTNAEILVGLDWCDMNYFS